MASNDGIFGPERSEENISMEINSQPVTGNTATKSLDREVATPKPEKSHG